MLTMIQEDDPCGRCDRARGATAGLETFQVFDVGSSDYPTVGGSYRQIRVTCSCPCHTRIRPLPECQPRRGGRR